MAKIVALGAGRMGRGIGQVFAYAGRDVTILDFKDRPAAESEKLLAAAKAEVEENLKFLVSLDVLAAEKIPAILERISVAKMSEAKDVLGDAEYIFEGVPEVPDAKEDAFKRLCEMIPDAAVVASTTSTMLSDDLARHMTKPERFLNAHFLNPAYLIPLVEVSPCAETDEAVVERFTQLLKEIGKEPVRCKASPGYIVPRLQSTAMNEAIRMVEEGVATPEDIDRAVRVGFGIRYATMGLIEFTDWGGVDILYYANKYLSANLDPRYASPPSVAEKMEKGELGLNAGKGYYDFGEMDVDAYRREKLSTFIALLRKLDLMPKATD